MKTEDLKLFHQIVESGSMNTASKILNLPKSSISRRIKGLEDELNLKLFHRQNRSLILTDAGNILYTNSKAALNQLELSIEKAIAPKQEVTGHLRIQVLPLPNVLNIGDTIFRFMDRHPKLTVEIISSMEDRNLVENHIDVAFRIGERVDEPNLVARPFISARLSLYASSDYVNENGRPKDVQSLKKHNVIRYRFPDGHVLDKLPIGKKPEFFEVSGNLIVNSMPLVVEACLLGRGVAYIPEQIARSYVQSGELVSLFDDIEPFVGHGWMVYQPRQNLTLAARTFIDFALGEMEQGTEFCSARSEHLDRLLI
ncbi:LysR family transcriptional regulator [Vibrio astriarenae]|uniref:LysR family transcriptional regulator n=1 Tax=Vibrio astriarenae TaxID=1481923 RepID=UPI003736D6E7